MSKKVPETLEERIERKKLQQLIDNRKLRFIELLGKDCEYIDALVIHTDISPWDVKQLLENGCPNDLIPQILL